MATVLRLKRATQAAIALFGSTGNTELAGLLLWGILGLIASVLVAVPGDQTAGGLTSLFYWLGG